MEKKLRDKVFPFELDEMYKECRLFCFHHAGGSVVIFNKWRNASPHVEIVPVEIPGRGPRIDEECMTDFGALTQQLADAIAQVYDGRSFFIYGHSLGSAIAFETTYLLESRYDLRPEKLFVAGRHAPHKEDPSTFQCSQGIEALKEDLLFQGMLDEETIEDGMFQKVFLPIIFNDYKLHERYEYCGSTIETPIVTLSGTEDVNATKEIMKSWAEVTNGSFTQYEYAGNHFFPYEESEQQVVHTLLQEIKESIMTVTN
ncbi:MAG: thioesterase [Eubacterium sp.]|nr:thioesterase [Eubacterium sp.]